MARACTLSLATTIGVLKGNLPALDDWQSLSLEEMVCRFGGMLEALAGVTPRLQVQLVARALRDLTALSGEEALLLSQRLSSAFSMAKKKAVVCTSKTRQSTPMRRLCEALQAGPFGRTTPEKIGRSSSGSGSSLGAGQQTQSGEAIWAMYGCKPPKGFSTPSSKVSPALEVYSSQEVESLQEEGEEELKEQPKPLQEKQKQQHQPQQEKQQKQQHQPQQRPLEWVDAHRLQFVRKTPQGEVRAALQQGPEGFCTACIEGVTLTTEAPNLLLNPVKPAAAICRKRPAAAAAKKPRLVQQEEQKQQEAGHEEEQEEEEEEGEALLEQEPEEQEPEEQLHLEEKQKPQPKPKPAASKQGPKQAAKAKAQQKGLKHQQPGLAPEQGEVRQWTKMFYAKVGAYAVRRGFADKRQLCQFLPHRYHCSPAEMSAVVSRAIDRLRAGLLEEADIKDFVVSALGKV